MKLPVCRRVYESTSAKGPDRTREALADSNLVLPQTGSPRKGLGQSEGALLETPFNTTGVVSISAFLSRKACASRERVLRLLLSRRFSKTQHRETSEKLLKAIDEDTNGIVVNYVPKRCEATAVRFPARYRHLQDTVHFIRYTCGAVITPHILRPCCGRLRPHFENNMLEEFHVANSVLLCPSVHLRQMFHVVGLSLGSRNLWSPALSVMKTSEVMLFNRTNSYINIDQLKPMHQSEKGNTGISYF